MGGVAADAVTMGAVVSIVAMVDAVAMGDVDVVQLLWVMLMWVQLLWVMLMWVQLWIDTVIIFVIIYLFVVGALLLSCVQGSRDLCICTSRL